MRKIKPGLSVLFTVTYLLIVVAALAIITLSVPTFVGNYFLTQRLGEQQKALNACSTDILPYVDEINPDRIYQTLIKHSTEQNGRILFVDLDNVCQADTFCRANGTVISTSELTSVLKENADFAYGYHKIEMLDLSVTRDNEYLTKTSGSFWSAYYAQTVFSQGKPIGALLLVSPVDDIVQNVLSVSRGLIIFSIIFIVIIASFTFYMSNRLTLSLRKFNRAISKMAGGDLSVRVDEHAIAEFGDVARAFNLMAEQLENLDASRNQFVSDASHELKTPLASMKILSESLLASPDAPPELYQEFLTDINNEVDRLSLVINDLLTLVKTDKGLETLVYSDVDLGKLLRKVVNSVEPLAAKKNITVSYQYSDVILRADELRLRQVCTNLIDNALKYSPEGTCVSVNLSSSLGFAYLTVTDQGIGISEDNLPHLFERFYRVDKARSRAQGGTGLGLAIVKQIIEQHGGTISVKSALGEGTTFTVTLPIKKEG